MLSIEQIRSTAPDDASFAAGQKIAKQAWLDSGASDRAIWGEIKGSGKTPYAVMVDLRQFAYRCSCPSRKLPCKHVLGLLLRGAENAIANADEPTRIVEWLEARDERAEKKKAKEEAVAETSTATNPTTNKEKSDAAVKAAMKTAAQRDARVAAGVELLQTQLEDLVRLGFASLAQKENFWADLSRRMIDAQAPGLARWVANCAPLFDQGERGREELLRRLGKLSLLLEAYRRIDSAPEELASEIRQAIGYNVPKQEILDNGERVDGPWIALGRTLSRNAQIFAACDWFWNPNVNRFAQYFQFSPNAPSFPEFYPVAARYDAAMRFWPGVVKLRATWETTATIDASEGRYAAEQMPIDAGVEMSEFPARASAFLAKAPWLQTIPALIRDVVVRSNVSRTQGENERRWFAIDRDGRALPIRSTQENEDVLAQYYGATYDEPCVLFAEWNGRELNVVSAWKNGSLVVTSEK